MRSEREKIFDLQDHLRAQRSGGWWGDGGLEADIEARKRRLAWYQARFGELLALANDRREALRLWERHCHNFEWGSQRLRRFRDMLIGSGLVDKARAMAIEIEHVDPVARAEALEAARESEALRQARKKIIGAAITHGKGAQQDVLAIYNLMGGFFDWDKLHNFCRELVSAKLLPATWLPGQKGSLWLEELHQKMLQRGGAEDKMLRRPGVEDKSR